MQSMHGKIVLVTGANSGIGQAAATALAKQGAQVVMVARSRERGEAALAQTMRESGSDKVALLLADLSQQREVVRLAEEFRTRFRRLDVLINNAAIVPPERTLTADGLETQFAVNHLAYFILTRKPIQPARRWRWLLMIPLVLLLLPILLVVIGYFMAVGNTTNIQPAPIESDTVQFDGSYLLAASDPDWAGSSYMDFQLRQIPDTDTLSILPLPYTGGEPQWIEVPASNAVLRWPDGIAVSPDGSTAYVVETRGPIPETQQTADGFFYSDIPAGELVTVVDLETRTPVSYPIGTNPITVSVRPDSEWLAVGYEDGRVGLLPTATLDDPTTFTYVTVDDTEPLQRIPSVDWHPSGDFLAVNFDAVTVRFYAVEAVDGGRLTMRPHGEPLSLGDQVTYGRFTNDGRFYLTAELYWNRPAVLLGQFVTLPSDLISFRFDPSDAAQHEEVARVAVGQSAESWAISPQEDLIVTVNMRRTSLPDFWGWWPGTDFSSLTLVQFDNQTGTLTPLGEYGFEGLLPQGIAFDADGDALAIGIHNEREPLPEEGFVEFWNVIREGDTPRLERTSLRFPVVRGPHNMAVVP
jgi:hypothetical protein